MDLAKLIDKSEKYAHRDLKYSMREFKFLKELKKDVVEIERLLTKQPDYIEVKNLLEFYKSKARKLGAGAARVTRRLNRWVRRLDKALIAEELKLSVQDRRYIEKFKFDLDVCKNNLVRILAFRGELQKAIKQEEWKSVETKIDEAFGNKKSPGVRTLTILLEQIESLEEGLKKRRMQKVLGTAPVITKQKLRVDMHFHPNFPSNYNNALNKSVKLWKALVKQNIDVILVTEHMYKHPDRAYRLMIEGRVYLNDQLLSEISKIKSKVTAKTSVSKSEKIKEIENFIFRLNNIEIFAGMEVEAIEGAELIVFTEHAGYDPKEIANELQVYEENLSKRGVAPSREYNESVKRFIQFIEGKCVTDLYLEKRFKRARSLTIPEVIDVCKQRGFGVYMPHPYLVMTGGVGAIGKKRLAEIMRRGWATKQELFLLGNFWALKTGTADRNPGKLLKLGEEALSYLLSGKFQKEFIELLGAEGLALIINHRKIGVSVLNTSGYLGYAISNKLSKLKAIGKLVSNTEIGFKKTVYTPQALIERANPKFYAGGTDAHSAQSLGSALAINVNYGNSSRREAIFKAIVSCKDPEISTEKTISALKIDSRIVIGTIKTGVVAGIETGKWMLDIKKWSKEDNKKIEELIAKTKNPETSFEELLELKKEANKPGLLLAMSDDQKKRYKEALKLRRIS